MEIHEFPRTDATYSERDELIEKTAEALRGEIVRQRGYAKDLDTTLEDGNYIAARLDLAMLAEKAIDTIVPHVAEGLKKAMWGVADDDPT